MTDLATFTTFDDLVRAIRARRIEIGLSQLAVDEMAGLASGYVAKLEASLTNPSAKNARSIGRESLPLVLGAIGMEIALVDPHRGPATTGISRNENNSVRRKRIKTLAERGQQGARIRWALMSEKQRAAMIRKMNRARAAKRAAKRTKQAKESV